ncbi:MAG TPA: endonuclease Q family protein [Candidatus Omnitrophota bacterium]|nr:endonuclease Q family protein [Candidatus Omnitrophota bacterium]
MKIIADFHIHSKYSRATSKEMEVGTLAHFAEKKGINLLGTGDFTHPQYFKELQSELEPLGNGFFRLKGEKSPVHFVLSAETSHIFSVKGKTHRVHVILLAPSLDVVEKINRQLARRGNIASDGRPIFGMHVKDMVKLTLDISPEVMIIPAHAWTPWFSVFGSASGFDSLEECFEEQAKNIYAIETGLSSDPSMNWRFSNLDRITLISNSDAHSPAKIGREANVLNCAMNYREVMDVIRTGAPEKFLYTIEFFPEEGKYHFDGHRDCGVVFDPKTSKEHQFICPKCGKQLTIGVMHRVEELADRPTGFCPEKKIPFKSMIPLDEILSDTFHKGVATQTVAREYEKMIQTIGPELEILLEKTPEEMGSMADPKVIEAILNVRNGKVRIEPGYDGCYGKIKVPSMSSSQKELFSIS